VRLPNGAVESEGDYMSVKLRPECLRASSMMVL
jgi:hypothetical protein